MAMSFVNIKIDLEKILRPERFEHVLRVNDTALKLNQELNLGLNEEKIQYACLLHDCAKHVEEKYFDEFKEKYKLDYNIVFETPALAHTILGPIVSKERYGMTNIDVLEAIRWHTTGKEDMSLLEKLVFTADYVEPGRDFNKLDKALKKLKDNFDEGILYLMNLQIKHLISKDAIINLDTIKARNFLQRRVNE